MAHYRTWSAHVYSDSKTKNSRLGASLQSRSIIKVAYEARTSNIRMKNNWGRQTTLRGAMHTSFQVGSFLADWKPVIPINDLMWFHNPVCLTDTTCPSPRKYNLGDRLHQLYESERRKRLHTTLSWTRRSERTLQDCIMCQSRMPISKSFERPKIQKRMGRGEELRPHPYSIR